MADLQKSRIKKDKKEAQEMTEILLRYQPTQN